jgi:hypothetical protein
VGFRHLRPRRPALAAPILAHPSGCNHHAVAQTSPRLGRGKAGAVFAVAP